MSKKNDDRKNIVIVGAGGGGASTARTLSAKLDPSRYNIILVNPRPYHLPMPAMPRVVVSDVDNLEEQAFPSLDKVFHNGNGTFVLGKVASIEKDTGKGGSVVLENGERIPFEVLVLATGSIWTGPMAFPDDAIEVAEFIKNGRDAFEKAQKIVIAGGGAVGIGKSFLNALLVLCSYFLVELAGELRDVWPVSFPVLVPMCTS